jgi:hypothetical protein
MDWFYGHTGFSFIDVWALVHFAFWVFFGSCVWIVDKKIQWGYTRILFFFGSMGLAFGWEGFEAYLAPRNSGSWGDWFTYSGYTYGAACPQYIEGCHYESWWNSWVSDPLTCAVGVVLIFILLDRRQK